MKREGKWQTIEIDQLTDNELHEFAQQQPVLEGWQWAKFLAKWIRDNCTETTGDKANG